MVLQVSCRSDCTAAFDVQRKVLAASFSSSGCIRGSLDAGTVHRGTFYSNESRYKVPAGLGPGGLVAVMGSFRSLGLPGLAGASQIAGEFRSRPLFGRGLRGPGMGQPVYISWPAISFLFLEMRSRLPVFQCYSFQASGPEISSLRTPTLPNPPCHNLVDQNALLPAGSSPSK